MYVVDPSPQVWGVGGWGVDAAYRACMSRTQVVLYMAVYRRAMIGCIQACNG